MAVSPNVIVTAEGEVVLTHEWVRVLKPVETRVYIALSQMYKNDIQLTLREIANTLEISQSALVKSLKNLQEYGLLRGLEIE